MNEKVLFVDDDPGLLRLITSELKNEAIEILTEESGAGALRSIRENAPSAVVLDFLLPDMSCKEMILRIRQDNPTLPIVLLVPQGCISEATECLGQGALDYVQKPFEFGIPDDEMELAKGKYYTYELNLLVRRGRQRVGLALRDAYGNKVSYLRRTINL